MKRVAAEIANREPPIDVLINNAGALFGTRWTEDRLVRNTWQAKSETKPPLLLAKRVATRNSLVILSVFAAPRQIETKAICRI
jgi:hypothetical protein